MRLKCLGSGSSGNCYILESEAEALIVEAGIPYKEVKKALDFNVKKIVGVVVGHCHLDHSRAAPEYEKAGIPVFKPYGSEMEKQVRTYGSFVIKSFPLVHDVPCFGFYISEPGMGNLIYASDTGYIKYRFKGLNHILVEANHNKVLLDRGSAKYEHQVTGHMEIGTACEFLKINKNPGLRNVVLLHLSIDSSDTEDFKSRAQKVVGCPVRIAQKGLTMDVNLCPF